MTHKEKHIEEDELAALKKVIDEHGKLVMGVIVLCMIVVFGYLFIKQKAEIKNQDASILLSTASNVQDLETLVNDYGSTDAAALADFALAKEYYNAGRFDEAIEIYKKFPAKFPESSMKKAAGVGILFCEESKGNYKDALSGFAKFISENPDSYLIEQVIFAKARCLQNLGQTAEARVVYESFIEENPDNPWVPNAEMLLKQL